MEKLQEEKCNLEEMMKNREKENELKHEAVLKKLATMETSMVDKEY